eukprot:TRINITY_DN3894_c1_g1_i3.p1 TRINITY_DN3894_c1_g1~~TRINITY_DN3894_c1_g1_i3.p1  ORF type:complete len:133 (+),score=7.49 TRINITY_DN3894_c1_g1_i3:32-430(+)
MECRGGQQGVGFSDFFFFFFFFFFQFLIIENNYNTFRKSTFVYFQNIYTAQSIKRLIKSTSSKTTLQKQYTKKYSQMRSREKQHNPTTQSSTIQTAFPSNLFIPQNQPQFFKKKAKQIQQQVLTFNKQNHFD